MRCGYSDIYISLGSAIVASEPLERAPEILLEASNCTGTPSALAIPEHEQERDNENIRQESAYIQRPAPSFLSSPSDHRSLLSVS